MKSPDSTIKFFMQTVYEERVSTLNAKAPTGSCPGFSKRGIEHGPLNMPPPHRAPHPPPHAVCGTDMWWVVRDSSIKSAHSRNGTLPLAPRTYSWIQLISRGAGWGSAALGSLCPFGFAPHYVAVQPGRCRCFIGTLLARSKYAPRTLRLEDKERRSKSLASKRETKNTIWRETISRSISRKKF